MILYCPAVILRCTLLNSLFSHIFLFKMKARKFLSQLGDLVKGEFTVMWEDGIKSDLSSLHAVMSLVGSAWAVL